MHFFSTGNFLLKHLDFLTLIWKTLTFLHLRLTLINSLLKLLNSVFTSTKQLFTFINFCRIFVVYWFQCFLIFLMLLRAYIKLHLSFLSKKLRLKVMAQQHVNSFYLIFSQFSFIYFHFFYLQEEIKIDLTINQVLL